MPRKYSFSVFHLGISIKFEVETLKSLKMKKDEILRGSILGALGIFSIRSFFPLLPAFLVVRSTKTGPNVRRGSFIRRIRYISSAFCRQVTEGARQDEFGAESSPRGPD